MQWLDKKFSLRQLQINVSTGAESHSSLEQVVGCKVDTLLLGFPPNKTKPSYYGVDQNNRTKTL